MPTSTPDTSHALLAALRKATAATDAAEAATSDAGAPDVGAPPAPTPAPTTIEAPTAREALAEVARRFGPDACITDARKVSRGGLGGFFARELVQVTVDTAGREGSTAPAGTAVPPSSVRPPDLSADDAGSTASSEAGESSPAVAAAIAALRQRQEAGERTFADVLRERMVAEDSAAREPVAAPAAADAPPTPRPVWQQTAPILATPAAPASPREISLQPVAALPAPPPAPTRTPAWPSTSQPLEPAVTAPAAAPAPRLERAGRWSATNLRRLGLPDLVVDAVSGLDPRDDAGCVAAVAAALSTLCRPLPAGDTLLAGPRVKRVATALRVPVGTVGSTPPARGDLAVAARGTARSRSWIAWARGERWLQVVVGGEGWRPLLFDDPLAVSWADPADVGEAVRIAAETGLVLGYGPGPDRRVARANGLDVALALRDALAGDGVK